VRLIHICVSQSNQKARTAQVSLELSLPAQLPKVRADEEKIGWVLMQLLDNAIKFNATGGRVITDARLDNDIVTIAVTDTGIGIPEDRVQDIFEPFHQLDGSATRRYGGTGLGLTMVRRILDAHGADIRVRSVVGRGSRFEFSLPVDTQ
jgi:signal transduction histidine kinase